ncbi:hypothetical protein HGA13_27200 [Nocardia speluncae]|uniref:Uncharacterized protein n=1 Tax=Nocardia speluncae TaxID=419477 RepID=A0A846XPV9_9NOCA|nr:hypothetical protein [Nocardia speluncae]NKY36730.1 hypothetical protein [Nocardia speluncae]
MIWDLQLVLLAFALLCLTAALFWPVLVDRPDGFDVDSPRPPCAAGVRKHSIGHAMPSWSCLETDGFVNGNNDSSGGLIVESDNQLGFDIDFDDKTQAWLDWVAPERMELGIRAFLAEVAPDVTPDSLWWKPPLSTKVLEAAEKLFGDWAGFVAPENWYVADGFVRFLGECYVRRSGMTWANRPEWGVLLYSDFGPAVRYGDDIRDVVAMSETLFRKNYGPRMVEYNMTDAGPQGRNST